MPNLELAEEDIDFLFNDRRFDYGGESIICKGNRKNTAYKIFVYPTSDEPTEMLDNKLEKIKRQYNTPLEYSVSPLRTITLFSELIGYEMTYDEDDIPLLDAFLTKEQLLESLKKTRNILDYYHSKDIIYGDIKDDNILINKKTGEIKFCDMDNIHMQDLPIDVMSQELADFFEEHQKADVIADHYMHNILTLYKLSYQKNDNEQIAKMIRQGTITELPTDEEKAKCIIKQMKNLSTYRGGYLIDYVYKEI